MAGFLYQIERALLWLATVNDHEAMIGVETEDDVSVRGELISLDEQNKHVLDDGPQPFQDRSVGLWKTLAGWLDSTGTQAALTDALALYLVTNRPVPKGALARLLADARSDDELDSAVLRLREIAGEPSGAISEFCVSVAAAEDDELRRLVRRICLADADAGGDADTMRAEVVGGLHLHPDEEADEIVRALVGWMIERLMAAWRAGRPGWLERAAFDRQLFAVRAAQRISRQRERAESMVPVSAGSRKSAREHNFVERLLEIEAEDDEIDTAIEAFLRHRSENVRLARQGDFTKTEWRDFYDELAERWTKIRYRLRRAQAGNAEFGGRRLLSETTYTDFRGSLGGEKTTHAYFTCGGYHVLADGDRVWWLERGGGGSDK